MGGARRIINRDFPEFYDQYSGLANGFDALGRFGFYPNIFISGFFASPLSNKEGIWQTGEVLPPTVRAPLEALQLASPSNPFVAGLREMLLPNRFRDYQTATVVNKNGGLGTDILDKRIAKVKLTEDEDAQWTAANRETAGWQILFDQTGLFRLKPDEKTQAQELAKQIILSHLPIDDDTYDEIRRIGYPIEEFFPFPPALSDALNGVDEIARWRGTATHLRESEVGKAIGMQHIFWLGVEERRTQVTVQNEILDQQYRTGLINRNTWEHGKRELDTQMARFIEERKLSEMFEDIPIEFEDRVIWAEEHNSLPPIQHPIEELIAYYFDKKPEDFQFLNDDVGQYMIDWNGFFKWRKVIENSLGGINQQEFLTRIRRWDTELDAFKRADYEEFINPYKAIFDVVLAEFDDDQKITIREFYQESMSAKREALREVLIEGTEDKLIAQFQGRLNIAKRNTRRVDPQLDARLLVWGEVSAPVEGREGDSRQIEIALYRRYGFTDAEAASLKNSA